VKLRRNLDDANWKRKRLRPPQRALEWWTARGSIPLDQDELEAGSAASSELEEDIEKVLHPPGEVASVVGFLTTEDNRDARPYVRRIRRRR
jgi:hypothetical protein